MSNKFVKRANAEVEFTHEDIQELKKCSKDPIYFIINYCFTNNQELGEVRFNLRPYQKEIVKSFKNSNFTILMIGRQAGKTETTAAYALWFSMFNKGKNVLIASNKQKAATDIMNRVRYMYERVPDFLRCGIKYYNRGSIEFDNESKIWSEATTEDTGRGKSVALFILDELAHVKKNVQEGMWTSIFPTISSGKLSCIIMSTPNGDTDLFAELWRGAEAGINGFNPIYVDITNIPGRDEAWRKRMIAKLGELKFRQEFLCEFLSSDPLLIKSMVLTRLKGTEPIMVEKGFKFWKEINPNKTYVLGSDVAEGTENDFSTIQVFELDTLEQVIEYRSNKINETQLYDAIKWIIERILSVRDPRTRKKASLYWSFENNAAGASIVTLLYNDEKFPEEAELVSGKGEKRPGMRTVNKTKMEACRNFKNLVEKSHNGFVINSKDLIVEMKNYISTGASYAAKKGSTDDLISGSLIVTRVIKYLADFEPGVFEKLYKSEEEFDASETSDSRDIYDEPVPFSMS